jgi:type IX secretion system PorP/SprF family membrane protein
MKKLLFLTIILQNYGIAQKDAFANDAQFSQFFANPLYHNPAFAGESGTTRLMATYRTQWNGLGSMGFSSITAGVDSYVGNGWGIGGLAFNDRQFKNFNTMSFSGIVSKNIIVNDNSVVQVGSQFGWIFNRVSDLNSLRFADQFAASPSAVLINPSRDPVANGTISYNRNHPDVSVGAIWKYSTYIEDIPLLWAGVSWHHIKFKETNDSPRGRFGLQAGFKIPHNLDFFGNHLVKDADREKSIAFTTYFRKQGRFSQLDFGLNMQYDPLFFGLWYRNLPLRRFDFTGQDALVFITGYNAGRLMIEYSYDLTVSPLRGSTGGGHEITIWYGLDYFLNLNLKGLDSKRKLKCTNF